jgi:hypothetical protein
VSEKITKRTLQNTVVLLSAGLLVERQQVSRRQTMEVNSSVDSAVPNDAFRIAAWVYTIGYRF